MSSASECMRRAQECLALAESMTGRPARKRVEMGHAWLRRAEQILLQQSLTRTLANDASAARANVH
jgi:hypothetical protein